MDNDSKKQTLDDTLDWEYMSDFYVNEEKAVKSLEDYMVDEDEDIHDGMDIFIENDSPLKKTVADVKAVRELSELGKSIPEIAQMLGLSEDYITTISFTLCSSTDDSSDIAIAHLVMMG